MELYHHTIRELHQKLKAGKVTSRAITESIFDRIEEV